MVNSGEKIEQGVGLNNSPHRIAVDSLRMRGRYAFGWGWVAIENDYITRLSFLFFDDLGQIVSTMGCELMGPREDVTNSLGPAFPATGFLIAGAVPAGLDKLHCKVRIESSLGIRDVDSEVFHSVYGRSEENGESAASIQLAQRPLIPRLANAVKRDGARKSLLRGMLGLQTAAKRVSERRSKSSNDLGGALIIDHAMGGGANKFSEALSSTLVSSGMPSVLKLSPDLGRLELVLSNLATPSIEPSRFASEALALQFLSEHVFEEIHLNHLVTYAEIPEFCNFLRGQVANGAKLVFYAHDFFSACPSWALMDADEKFCGVPSVDMCRTCLPRNRAPFLSLYSDQGIEAWRASWREIFDIAHSVVVFSNSTTTLLERAYPGISSKVICRPHDVPLIPNARPIEINSGGVGARVAILGHLSVHKGGRILAEIARSSQEQGLDMTFHVFGSINEPNLPSNLRVEGPYTLPELAGKLEAAHITVGFLPSICAETFSYVTSEMMQLSVPVACFDRGAPAERVRNYEFGMVLETLDARVVSQQLKEFSDTIRVSRAQTLRAIPTAQSFL